MAASIARKDDEDAHTVEVGNVVAHARPAPERDVLAAAAESIGVEDFAVEHAGGRWVVSGRVEYQLDREQFLEAIKDIDGWERDVVVQLEIEKRDVRGYHTVAPGETLAALADRYLGSAHREWDIVEVNRDFMNHPDQILPGQKLLIPRR